MNNQRVVGMWAYAPSEAKGQKRSQGLLGGRDELTEGHKEKQGKEGLFNKVFNEDLTLTHKNC